MLEFVESLAHRVSTEHTDYYIDRMTLATGKKQCDEELGFTGVK